MIFMAFSRRRFSASETAVLTTRLCFNFFFNKINIFIVQSHKGKTFNPRPTLMCVCVCVRTCGVHNTRGDEGKLSHAPGSREKVQRTIRVRDQISWNMSDTKKKTKHDDLKRSKYCLRNAKKKKNIFIFIIIKSFEKSFFFFCYNAYYFFSFITLCVCARACTSGVIRCIY